MKNFFTTCFLVVFSLTSFATTYYLSSSSGNDNNSGTDPSSPWQSIDKLNSFYNLQPGDNVLFKSGDTFYGGIVVNSSGSSGSPITYGSYGSGSKPIITGFTNVTSWVNRGGNIWESTNPVSTLSSLKMVVINGVNTPMGRYPNGSNSYPFLPNFFNFQSHSGSGSGNTSITSSSLSGGSNWTGADVVVRVNSWTFDKETIASQSGNTVNYAGQSGGIADGWGFFIQNDIKTLDVQNEWYYNPSTKKISIYSIGTPSNVQLATVETLFNLNSNLPAVNNINIDNLSFTGANTNAIWISGNLICSVTNSNISYTGGDGLVLYGGGIQGGTINNNTFSNCGGSSISTTGSINGLTVKSNTIVGSGIISAYKQNDYSSSAMLISSPNSLIQYNSIDSSVYCGIEFSGNNIQVRNNFVNHSNMVRDDGGGIYTGYKDQVGKIIDGNIVLNSVGNINGGGPGKELAAYGIFIDDFGTNISITNNTVANGSSAGINLHDTKNVTVDKNTVYNNGIPGWSDGNFYVQADAAGFTGYVRNNTVTNNILFARNADQYSFKYYADPNGNNNVTSFGTIDYNYYAKPISVTTAITSQQNIANGDFSLSNWQSLIGMDANSKESPKSITDTKDIRFEYNASTQSKTVALDANYIDVKGNNYNGSITLAPYSSAVLILNGALSNNLLPAVNPSNTVNGIDYKYFEASSYNLVPDFSQATPVKTGNVTNFDLSVANRAEQFAVNFTGYIDVPSDGEYTFYTSSDDGSLLYIDGIQVVNNDGSHSQQENSGIIGLKAGKHAISVGFFQAGGDKVLQVSYAGPGVSKQLIPSSSLYRVSTDNLLPAVNPSNTVNGINYAYFESGNYTALPDFSQATPVKTGSVTNFDISVANRADQFAINFTGYINVPSDGQYTFYTSSDDGSSLYIDGVLVVNNDGLHSQQENSGVIGLQAGKHAISVGFFQQAIDKVLQVSYAGPGVSKQLIPSSSLYRVSTDNLLPAVNPSNTVNGLNYAYFESGNYSAVPDFSQATPVKTGSIDNFDISVANRADQFAINFTGYIDVPSDGQYTFYTSSDDGSLLYIDGIQVVNNDGAHSQQEQSNTIGLQAGKHAISVGFFQQAIDKVLQVSYAGPGVSKQLIPSSALYRVSTQFRKANLDAGATSVNSATDTSINKEPVAIGLNNSELQIGVKAYPNPFTNSILVNISGDAGKYTLLLVDELGRTIWKGSGNKGAGTYQQSINTSSLQRGIYFLQVIQNNNRSVIKLEK